MGYDISDEVRCAMYSCTGARMYALAEELFPACRSITGEGTRPTLKGFQRDLSNYAL